MEMGFGDQVDVPGRSGFSMMGRADKAENVDVIDSLV
jgi:hypothetical protein